MTDLFDHNLDFDRAHLRETATLAAAQVVDDFPLGREIANREVFIIRNCESRYLTHDFHKFAGKFIPHIPRWAMRKFMPRNGGKVVLDPFMGSGTTLVEAMLDGQQGYGIDIDPLARLISKVKTTPIPEAHLKRVVKKVVIEVEEAIAGPYRPNIEKLNHWFSAEAVEELSSIHQVIERFRTVDPAIYDFLTVCFSSIVRKASNADNQTMKTYVSHTHRKVPQSAKPLFIKTLVGYADRLTKFSVMVPTMGQAHVLVNDARHLSEYWKKNKLPLVDIAISSPPYIKSVDYIYNQMAELFWIGDRWNLHTQPLQNDYKRLYIGNDRPNRDAVADETLGISNVDIFLHQIGETNQKLRQVAFRYFRDMRSHFESMYHVLKPGARYVLVVGDSTLAGVAVPTHSLLQSCAMSAGFRPGSIFGYEIRNKHMRFPRQGRGGIVSHDWVMELNVDK